MDYSFRILYPEMVFVDDRGLIPKVNFPPNYRSLVPNFYEGQGQEKIEEFAKRLEAMVRGDILSPRFIRLNWDENLGLRNISVGVQGGFDLNEQGIPGFAEHNLGGMNGVYAMLVAIKYVHELLRHDK